ncbi:MAG: signal recognition particle-docking protein FtsY, partial [Acidobacteria bacterium]|nr:signal recognition particle-docking protein FtsY [Acidobacteriota bacterium]
MFGKIRQGLIKTRETFGRAVESIFKDKKEAKQKVDELEETLILADIGLNTVQKLLKDILKEEDPKKELIKRIRNILVNAKSSVNSDEKPYIHIFVGVNGVGKTTTIGKIAKKRTQMGEKGIIAACDTFRAAASEQLEVWAERSGTEIVKQKEGADPASVAFDAVSKAKARNYDFCLIDTAGRLHTKHNLMEELQKISRVSSKALLSAPHQVSLVLDATTGQNGLVQAKTFAESVEITDIMIAKLDGTAKGGIAFA